jgi:GT2 family glycosyltransferase
MKYSFIIPFFNKWELTHNRLYEFFTYLPPEGVEIILVDDCSTDPNIDGGVAFWQKKLSKIPIRYRKLDKNVGFGGAMNSGASIAKGDIIILYSNDVVCSGNFLPKMQEFFDKDPNILLGNEIIYWNTEWNSFDVAYGKALVPYVNGWFMACTKEVWSAIGGFDPLYGKYTMEDVDISMKAYTLGYSFVALDSPFLKHLVAQTAGYTEERMEITKQNKIKFFEKWKTELEK